MHFVPRSPPNATTLHRLSGRAARRQRGQSTVEFAIICVPLLLIIFAIIDYAQVYFYENSLQNALRESTRFATAGDVIQKVVAGVPQYDTNSGVATPQAITDPYGGGGEASRYACIEMWFKSNCVVNIPLTNIYVVHATALPGAPPVIALTNGYETLMQDTNTPAAIGPGQANDYIQVSAFYKLNTITPLMSAFGGFNRGKGINYYNVHVSAIVKNEPALLNFEHTAVGPNDPTNMPP